MKNVLRLFVCGLLLPISSYAQLWEFTEPLDVTPGDIDKVFHHLEASGRRSIAVSDNSIALVWEDNRSGKPAVYLALKNKHTTQFLPALKISSAGAAYEPGIVALEHDRFAISWEEHGKISVRIINAHQPISAQLKKVLQLPAKVAMQSALSARKGQLYVVFSELAEHFNQLRLVQLAVDSQDNLSVEKNCRIDPEPISDDQLYPTILNVNNGLMIAWEDRRKGHTIIMGTLGQVSDICRFPPAQRISKRPGKRKLPYGKGYGVARVALMLYGKSQVMAAWADKRNFREGYDIYAASYDTAEGWSHNQSVQDEFGGVARQWHAAVAGHENGQRLVAWSDEREGTSDIFYSWFENQGWSDDMPMPGASGPGEQAHPVIALDNDSQLHIAWVERKAVGGVTRLRYMSGRLKVAASQRNK